MTDRLSHINFDHKRYANQCLKEDDRVAYMSVLLCVVAVAQLACLTQRARWIDEGDMHKYYPIFGRAMAVPESFLEIRGDKCRAVSIFYREENLRDRDNVRWMPIILEVMRNEYNDLVDLNPDRQKIRLAAREICREVFPNWDWDSVTA